MTAAAPQLAEVRTRRDLAAFVELPFRLYSSDRHWVPPLRIERKAFLSPRRNPFFRHADVALWLALRDGEVVGRISSHIDHLHDRVHNEHMGMFGFFEAVDEATAHALLARAREWVRERGAVTLRGPLSFSLNHEAGLIVEGWDHPPVVFTPWSSPAYPRWLAGFGLEKAMDLLEFHVRRSDSGLLRGLSLIAERAARQSHVRVRPGDMRHFEHELRAGLTVVNRAWRDNWGFVPPTAEELSLGARLLKPLVDPRVSFIAEIDGSPIGVALCIRDLNQVLPRVNGRLMPLGWFTIWRGLRRVTTLRFLFLGVLQEYRGLGVEVLLIKRTLEAALAAGYQTLVPSWILETNRAMLGLLERRTRGSSGGLASRRYRIYDMPA